MAFLKPARQSKAIRGLTKMRLFMRHDKKKIAQIGRLPNSRMKMRMPAQLAIALGRDVVCIMGQDHGRPAHWLTKVRKFGRQQV